MKKTLGFALLVLIPFALACPLKTNTATDVVAPGDKKIDAGGTPAASGTETPKKDENKEPLYLLRDSGKRCITSPCPSWAAVNVESRVEKEITGIDLSAMKLDAKAAESARQRVLAGQVWVHGKIETVPKQGPAGDGTVLVITGIVDRDEAPKP